MYMVVASLDKLKQFVTVLRALLEADPEYRGSLKRAGLLTRDPRMKERKNQVLKARRSPQFSKR